MGALRGRGFTLLELSLVGALLSAVTLLLVQALTPCLRIWSATLNVSEVRTLGVLTQQKVLSELRASSEKSLSTGNSRFSFLTVAQEGGYNPVNGSPIYRKVVAYWLADGALWRRADSVPGLPSASPFALTASELDGFCGNGRRVCADVSEFSLLPAGDHLWKLRLDTRKGMVTCRRESDLFLRN